MSRRPLTAFDPVAVVSTEHTDLVRALTCIAAGTQISAVLPQLITSALHAERSVGVIVTQCLRSDSSESHGPNLRTLAGTVETYRLTDYVCVLAKQ